MAVRFITTDAEAQAEREATRKVVDEIVKNRDPRDLPPIEGPGGTWTWDLVEEERLGMLTHRPRRVDD